MSFQIFLFLVRLRFSSSLSTIEVFRNLYGSDIVKLVKKIEKLDFKYRKTWLGLGFLETCIKNKVTPRFVLFRVAIQDL